LKSQRTPLFPRSLINEVKKSATKHSSLLGVKELRELIHWKELM
jgi:hypothetical protein